MRIVVVTGGGAGIGRAIAEELGRNGDFVVTVDPLVSLDGSAPSDTAAEPTTADRIVAAGGHARASGVSVTDAAAVRVLFNELLQEFGRLDAVVNVAGISRPTSFAAGDEIDWRAVVSVHLDGYRNVLEAALPIMTEVGHGRILGVTSGGGWRQMDAGAYGVAKRAVASLTWQLARRLPPDVVVNAISPIAVTRMVTAALARSRPAATAGAAAATGPLFGSMPEPEQLGPLGAHLVGDGFSWCNGEVIFTGGSEIAVVEHPRLIEVVRTTEAKSLAHVVDDFVTRALVPAEEKQLSGGGSNPRFPSVFDDAGGAAPSAVGTCAVVSDRPAVANAVVSSLKARGVQCTMVPVSERLTDFAGAATGLAAAVERLGSLDAVVVALSAAAGPDHLSAWEQILVSHDNIVDELHTDASWSRAVADYSAAADRPVRLVTITDAVHPGGRSRGQAAAQLARSARKATGDRVAAFAVSVESDGCEESTAALTASLLCGETTPALSGAELVVGASWIGLRSHPRPSGSITFGGPEIPDWLDHVLRTMIAGR